MPALAVTKMHGTLNDFVVIDQRRSHLSDLAAFARWVCDRRGAIGADGVLAILPSQTCDARMRVINADGGEAEMCGNGIRCVARYLSEAGLGDELRIETIAGPIETKIVAKHGQRDSFEVRENVGVPRPQERPIRCPGATFVAVGNPHVVVFAASFDDIDLPRVGNEFQHDATFPDGTNVHVAVHTGAQSLDVRHWERGVGLTHACGTGAVACAAAAILRGLVTSPVDVRVPGGRLRVEWDSRGDAYLTGPAMRVFDATIDIADAVAAP